MNPSPNPRLIRILLVDDHQVVRAGLKVLLGRFPDMLVVGEAGTVHDAVASTARLMPDVVLLDIRLSDGSGFEVCQRLQSLARPCRVIMLTSFADDETVYRAVAAGAHGYLLKELDATTLANAVRTVAAGQSILDPAVTAGVLARIRQERPSVEKNRLDSLSLQERKVLALVAEGKTNKEIGVLLKLSDKTVKNYLSHILEKLSLSRRSQAAAFFVQHGSAAAGTDLPAPCETTADITP